MGYCVNSCVWNLQMYEMYKMYEGYILGLFLYYLRWTHPPSEKRVYIILKRRNEIELLNVTVFSK